MKIILSPAKKMKTETDLLDYIDLPEYLDQAEEILAWMKTKSYGELKELWGCNDKLAEMNFRRLELMDLKRGLTPAVISYEGIAYQFLAPTVFEDNHFR